MGEYLRRLGIAFIGLFAVTFAAAPAHALEDIPEPFQGFYYQHAGGMRVNADGTINVRYQWYFKRDNGTPSFPEITLGVAHIQGNKLSGRVLSKRNAPVMVGSRFTVTQRAPGMRLRLRGFPSRWYFCDDDHQGRCGA